MSLRLTCYWSASARYSEALRALVRPGALARCQYSTSRGICQATKKSANTFKDFACHVMITRSVYGDGGSINASAVHCATGARAATSTVARSGAFGGTGGVWPPRAERALCGMGETLCRLSWET